MRSQQARGYRSLLLSSLLVGTLAAPTGAQQPVTPVIGVSSPTIDFGQVAIGQPAYINDDLFNAVTDSTSILEVTDMSVVGEGFSIYSPPDSVDIPGDGTTVILPIRFRPTAQNPASGTLIIIAPNAVNSPFHVLLSGDGILDDDLFVMGYDAAGTPIYCGTTEEDAGALLTEDPNRGWVCIPSVITNNGTDSFIIEVDTRGPVNEVTLQFEPEEITYVPMSGSSPPFDITLRDDGLEGDRVAGDFIFTSGEFKWNPAEMMDDYLWNDFSGVSPAGLQMVNLEAGRLSATHPLVIVR